MEKFHEETTAATVPETALITDASTQCGYSKAKNYSQSSLLVEKGHPDAPSHVDRP